MVVSPKIGALGLFVYTSMMGVRLFAKAPFEYSTKAMVEDQKKPMKSLPKERLDYFINKSKEFGYNANYNKWDFYLSIDDAQMEFGSDEYAIVLTPHTWALGERDKKILETYQETKTRYRNDTSTIEHLTFKDIDNDKELRKKLIEDFRIVPITKDEEDANIEVINTTLKFKVGQDMISSNAKAFAFTFFPLIAISKLILPYRYPIGLTHLILPFLAVEATSYLKDKQAQEEIFRDIFNRNGPTPLINYKSFLNARMHFNAQNLISPPSGDNFLYPWMSDKINIIDDILKENHIQTTNFQD
ncbi:hypothetical protein DFA_03415 [Cavenderia fasciculata]|uniref:Uncharacterized protein n=1 Tax=Cavenderia fasciculata TaxID=261658 RepID=F4PHI3_CACFS|nr:uncharacterized protein DFA_03415 [Cavenderia fasciculata]EGG25167.1 hypothetical protein DFA_03415 [Cavenderia fasciculata]|eukprot:XP_004363018.1 hypothetical protein DFA_03415 [Cavenderia fasciculata]